MQKPDHLSSVINLLNELFYLIPQIQKHFIELNKIYLYGALQDSLFMLQNILNIANLSSKNLSIDILLKGK